MIRLHRAPPAAEPPRAAEPARRPSALSDFLAGGRPAGRGRRLRRGDPAAPGPPALAGDAAGDRPLPGPDPRRPVAHRARSSTCATTTPASSPLAARRRLAVGGARLSSSAAGRSLLPLAIVAALPFRVPLQAGGDTANLLVPLYLVIAAGVVFTLLAATGPPRPAPGPPRAAGLAAGRLRRPLRGPDPLLGRLLQGPAERLLLPRPLHARLPAAARGRVGPPAADPGALAWSGSRPSPSSLIGCGRVPDPEPVLERPGDPLERIPHLLPGQLGLLGPQRLRALPGAGDRGRDGGAAVGEGAARPSRC